MAEVPTSPQHSGPGRSPAEPLDLCALVAEFHAPLYRYAFRLAGCPAEAEDLTQQTYLIAQQKLAQVRQAERVRSWLYAVLRSCWLKRVRQRPSADVRQIDLELDHLPGEMPSADAIDQEELQAALAELPAEFRVVLLMFYFEELSYKEIAEQLQLPLGTVMSRLSRAKGHLRQRLSPPPTEPTVAGAGRGKAAAHDGSSSLPVSAPLPVRSAR